ncbi:unnamed protein product [Arctia plantaginis]|uniref:Uncharacterized protein n=1 Tax=Arctia plantaginis TaxID=874455 RepID=A0A8S1AK37_ARCPL|nr:unnamed protein product [Arctia plantaginis]
MFPNRSCGDASGGAGDRRGTAAAGRPRVARTDPKPYDLTPLVYSYVNTFMFLYNNEKALTAAQWLQIVLNCVVSGSRVHNKASLPLKAAFRTVRFGAVGMLD